MAGEVQRGQNQSERQLDELRRHQNRLFVDPIGEDAAQQHEGDEGQFTGELAPAEVRRILELGVNDPGEGDVLNPRADAG